MGRFCLYLTMEIEIILYVKDLFTSKHFYAAVLNLNPTLDVDGMVEFTLSDSVKIGLMPEKGIAKIICPALPSPASGNGIPRCELYLKCPDFLTYYKNALHANAKIISEPTLRNWGHTVAYVADPDGHVLAFAG